MRKFGTQIISAVLAGCMMASVLPVSAFALETGADVENGVNAQAEAVTKIEDSGTDYIISEPGVYSMEGTYAHRVIINTDGDVTIHVTGNIDYTNASKTGNVALWQVVKVNELTIENENQYTVQTTVPGIGGPQLLREEYGASITKITVKGGIYKQVCSNSAFQFSSSGKVDLKNVITIGGNLGAVYSNRSCEVTITGGKYTASGEVTISNCGTGTMNIYGGTFEGNQVIQNASGTMLIDEGATIIGTFGVYDVVVNYGNGKLTFKDGTVEIKGGSPRAALCGFGNSETIVNGGTLKDAEYGVKVASGTPKFTLMDATFINNKNDIYLNENQKITIEDTFTKRATVKVADDPVAARRPVTTTNNPVKRNLVSNHEGYLIAYDKADGHYYLTPRTAGKFTVDAEDAKAVAEIDGVSTELDANTEIAKDTRVDLTAVAPGAGWELIGWELKVAGEDKTTELLQDADTENPWFTMPEGNVTVRALYNFVGTDDGAAGASAGGAIAAVVVGAAATWGVYEAGTGIYRMMNMRGIPLPSNRAELAMLIWERAGKPEPESTALYDDIDEEDTDLQKAAHWMVEQDLMDEKADNTFKPNTHVTKLRVCTTWEKAKQKGLFDKTEE